MTHTNTRLFPESQSKKRIDKLGAYVYTESRCTKECYFFECLYPLSHQHTPPNCQKLVPTSLIKCFNNFFQALTGFSSF